MRSKVRTRQALVAGVIAFVLLMVNFTSPLDQLVWATQSRIVSFEASRSFVFVGSGHSLSDPGSPKQRAILAEGLDRIAKAGADRVYVDAIFDRPSTRTADRQLHRAMQRYGDKLYLVQNYETGIDGDEHLVKSYPGIADGIRHVAKNNYTNYLGYLWDAPFSLQKYGDPQPSLPVAMAGFSSSSPDSFPINFNFRLASIPSLKLEDLVSSPDAMSDEELAKLVGNRTVLIGNAVPSSEDRVSIPGHPDLPASLVQIYAAETLKAGLTERLTALAALLPYLTLLISCIVFLPKNARRVAYAVIALSLPILVTVCAHFGIRVSVGGVLLLLFLYGFLRAKENWKYRFKLVDPVTNLATFAALEESTAKRPPALIVGKIHRLEDVKRTMPAALHHEYILKIVERLRFHAKEQRFFIGHGHFIAWCMAEKNPGIVREHLEGLRAILSAPLTVGDRLVDVNMTFGVDMNPSLDITKRLAGALAAADQSTEAYNPIVTTDSADEEDLLWNISLQTRIDAALANDEISLVYQPKILISTGDIVGAEALVRWVDPVRGSISPDVFIRQCESSGRMLHLTRYVLREACKTGNEFRSRNLPLPIAVNVSATLLHDREIVRDLRAVLEETGFEPSLLTLEITETFRIQDLKIARGVLTQISELGVKLSMDDFGVGAASFEALLHLPFDELKIDRIFVSRILVDPKARGIVRHILLLGKDLRMIVVAEGVEDPATLAALRDLGGLVAQGFGISPPLLSSDVVEFARSTRQEGISA